MRILKFILIFSALLISTNAAAEPLPLVISPTRESTPLGEVGSSVTLITEEDIKKSQRTTVVDVLRTVPGVSVTRSGGVGQIARVFIRGADSNHVLVLIDGVEANDPSSVDNAFDFANLSVDNIERIEVLRGPQGTLYGSEAIGGVISITTKKGQGPLKHFASLEAGSYQTFNQSAGASGNSGDTRYSMSLSHRAADGFSATTNGTEKDGSENSVFSTRVDHDLTDVLTAHLALRYGRSSNAFDDALPQRDANNKVKRDEFSGRLSADLSLLEGAWTHEVGLSRLVNDAKQFGTFPGATRGMRDKLDWLQHFSALPRHRQTLGVEYEKEYYKGQDSFSAVNEDAANKAFFAQDYWKMGETLFITSGVRVDDHAISGGQFTYRIAPAYTMPATKTLLKASYGTGFKAPALYELYDPFYGNTALKPEHSRGWDAGFEQPLGAHAGIGVTYFENNIRNLINADSTTFVAINIDRARTRGVETTGHVAPMPQLLLSGSYTFTVTEDLTTGISLLRRPKHKASARADYTPTDAVSLGAEALFNGKRLDSLFPGYVEQGAYMVVNLNGEWRMNPAVTWFSHIDNLLDKHYEEVFGYATPGLSAFAGVKVEF